MASVAVPPACPLQDASSQDVASEDLEVVGPAQGKAQSRATLDELLATLRLLEEEPEPLPNPRAYHRDKSSWTNEVTAGCILPRPSPGCRCHLHGRRGRGGGHGSPLGLCWLQSGPNKGRWGSLNRSLIGGLAEV